MAVLNWHGRFTCELTDEPSSDRSLYALNLSFNSASQEKRHTSSPCKRATIRKPSIELVSLMYENTWYELRDRIIEICFDVDQAFCLIALQEATTAFVAHEVFACMVILSF